MIAGHLKLHTVTVEPYEGSGAHGPIYGAELVVKCYVEEQRRLVRADTGEEVVSSTTVFCGLDDNIPAGSKVTVNGRTTTALTVARFDTGGRSRLDHQEVALA